MEVDVLYWDIVTYITDIICIYIEGYFCYRFVKPFLSECKRDYYIWITYAIVNMLIFYVPCEVSGSVASAILSATIFTVMYFMDKRNVEQKIFLSMVCYLLEWVTWGMVVSMWNTSFNNSINNAIEAAVECENPFVKILSYRKNNVYMIEIRNSIMEPRTIDSYSGMPVTTKSGEGHGFGLANVKKVAQKYYGDIDIEQSGNEFILAVMLMVE